MGRSVTYLEAKQSRRNDGVPDSYEAARNRRLIRLIDGSLACAAALCAVTTIALGLGWMPIGLLALLAALMAVTIAVGLAAATALLRSSDC